MKRIIDKNMVKLYAMDNPNCEICENIGSDVHHIIFRSQGGGDNDDNLITLCRNHHNQAHGPESKRFREMLLRLKSRKN